MGSGLEKIKIISLHGFLGLPSDWELIQSHFMISPLTPQFEWWSVDYMNIPGLDPENDFSVWAKNFNNQVLQRFPKGPRLLVGYSLGGRLALHALRSNPELYKKAIFISTNPGLQRDKEKIERAENDQKWAERFLNTPWPELMASWNSQAVFRDSLGREPLRSESSYDRNKLAKALQGWSLALQEDFRDFLVGNGGRILWACGEKDIKFANVAMELIKRSPQIQTEIFSRSAHRVLFDQPSELAARMISFLQAF
ncbi:MAG: alpha/beta fold hydrolase [Pseudobdellovibrionaceae bacterium]